MPQTYTGVTNDRRSLTHTGSDLGASHVTLSQNATGREDQIIAWECPRKYTAITYSAGRHITKFIPRSRENADGDGSQTTFTTTADLRPPSGETTLDDMPYQPVVAYDDDAGQQLEVTGYDFDKNEVTFANAPNNATGNVLMWPVLVEGVIKFIGHDQFGNRVAALDSWGIPIRVFNDFDQEKNITQVHLTGAATWEESEELVLYLDGPRQIVWADADYPEGEYASTIEQRVDVDA
jgi:hypothetical protein